MELAFTKWQRIDWKSKKSLDQTKNWWEIQGGNWSLFFRAKELGIEENRWEIGLNGETSGGFMGFQQENCWLVQ